MKLVGVIHGEVEGHKWASLQLTEPCDPRRGYGESCVSSKINYDKAEEIMRDWSLYQNQSVRVIYNRFGRAESVDLVE